MRCEFIKENGEQCKANAIDGDTMCFFHSPAMEEARKAGRRQAGRKKVEIPEHFVHPDNLSQLDQAVVVYLQEVVERLRKMDNTGEVNRALTTALSTLDKVLERRHEMRIQTEVPYEIIWPE